MATRWAALETLAPDEALAAYDAMLAPAPRRRFCPEAREWVEGAVDGWLRRPALDGPARDEPSCALTEATRQPGDDRAASKAWVRCVTRVRNARAASARGAAADLSEMVAAPLVAHDARGAAVGDALVTCTTPTSHRRHAFHGQLYASFCAQRWPRKELLILDTDGPPSPFFTTDALASTDARVTYVHRATTAATLGDKRNELVLGARGDFVALFDDDAIYGREYIATVVGALVASGLQSASLDGGFYRCPSGPRRPFLFRSSPVATAPSPPPDQGAGTRAATRAWHARRAWASGSSSAATRSGSTSPSAASRRSTSARRRCA